MNKIKKIALSALAVFITTVASSQAACNLCAIAVGAGLGGARYLGIDDGLTGVWSGGLITLLFIWTVQVLRRKGVKNQFLQVYLPFLLYFGAIIALYFIGIISFGENGLFELQYLDRYAVGFLLGAVALIAGERWYLKIKKSNNGRAQFPFQKVVMPVFCLLIATGVMAALIYGLGA